VPAVRETLSQAFRREFGRDPELGACAPGRVNLIGEHTDYNEGLVLPCAIDREIVALGARRADGRFRVWARDLGERGEFEVEDLARRGSWLDYVQGVVFALSERGLEVAGLDLALASRLPRESGLSSSAALEVAVATLLDRAGGLGLGARERACLAHRAESGFVGVACGIMDQFASALGREDHALAIDCRSLAVREVPLPRSALALLVVDSGVRRALVAGGYGDRRAECAEALGAAREARIAPGLGALRDLEPAQLPALARALPERLFRRARHVITENARVAAAVRALEARDLATAGACLREGMRSLRDDFEVSTPELDFLCARADAHPGVLGSRLTGAGFGGCTLHLVRPDAVEDVSSWIADGFESRFARRPPVLQVAASAGAREVAP
jgi:galactokinase